MYFRDTVTLHAITYSTSSMGDLVETTSNSTIFADKRSVRQSEFYQALGTGLKPELAFAVRSIDYNNQPKLTYNSKKYDIVRTYDVDGEIIELICSSIVGTSTR